jgi:hypothetical protein
MKKPASAICAIFCLFIVLAFTAKPSSAASVAVDEYWYAPPGSGPNIGEDGFFHVYNNSSLDLFVLVVAGDEFETLGFHENSPDPGTRWYVWRGDTVSKSEWETGFDFSLADEGYTSATYYDVQSEITWTPPDTSTYDWATYFGDAQKALMYWTGVMYEKEGTEVFEGALEPGGDYDGFLFFASGPASPFLAFGYDGSVVFDSGETTVVPAPGTVWLLGSGLIGLAGLRRRGRSPKGGLRRLHHQ